MCQKKNNPTEFGMKLSKKSLTAQNDVNAIY
jgi:hypothetical protein